MDIIFVGNIIDPRHIDEFPAASIAGNKMQCGIATGLGKYANVQVISSEPHASYRIINGEPLFVKRRVEHVGELEVVSVGYVNLPILKQLITGISIKKELRNLLSSKSNAAVLLYNTLSYKYFAIRKAINHKSVPLITIVADVPLTGRKSILQDIEDKKEIALIGKSDAVIGITQNILDDFAPSKMGVVIECGFEKDSIQKIEKTSSCKSSKDSFQVVFSGTLNSVSGIECFIEAAKLTLRTNASVYFHIYGDGEKRAYVEKMCQIYSNVFFHGKVPNSEMIRIQMESDILVCPRLPDDFVTKYTFPSKVIEYITAGKPVICNRLSGIPDEYETLVNFTKEATAESLSDTILKIVNNYDNYQEKSVAAKKYALSNKNWETQSKKIYSFVCAVVDSKRTRYDE